MGRCTVKTDWQIQRIGLRGFSASAGHFESEFQFERDDKILCKPKRQSQKFLSELERVRPNLQTLIFFA